MKYQVSIYITVLAFMGLSLKYSIKPDGVGDRTIGFLRMVNIYHECIAYCEEMNLYDKEIETSFNMYYYLKKPFMGYLSADHEFKKVNSCSDSKLEYAIITSAELSETAKAIQQSNRFELIKRFGQEPAFCEVYKKTVY